MTAAAWTIPGKGRPVSPRYRLAEAPRFLGAPHLSIRAHRLPNTQVTGTLRPALPSALPRRLPDVFHLSPAPPERDCLVTLTVTSRHGIAAPTANANVEHDCAVPSLAAGVPAAGNSAESRSSLERHLQLPGEWEPTSVDKA